VLLAMIAQVKHAASARRTMAPKTVSGSDSKLHLQAKKWYKQIAELT